MERSGREREALIVERLGGEMLVYDTKSDEAYCLGGAAAVEFRAAPTDLSRRAVIRKLAVMGGAIAASSGVVTTIIAPTPAQAQSCVPANGACVTLAQCCDLGPLTLCCPGGFCAAGVADC
jgi:hypothetical protein